MIHGILRYRQTINCINLNLGCVTVRSFNLILKKAREKVTFKTLHYRQTHCSKFRYRQTNDQTSTNVCAKDYP